MADVERPTRVAARVLLLDPASRVLLFEGRDLSDASDTVRYWFTAGGAVEEGESLVQTARREVEEETGHTGLHLAGPFHRREVDFVDHGRPCHQVEHYFAARVGDARLGTDGWTDLERRATTSWRWWAVDELDAAGVVYFPENLAELVGLARAALLDVPDPSHP